MLEALAQRAKTQAQTLKRRNSNHHRRSCSQPQCCLAEGATTIGSLFPAADSSGCFSPSHSFPTRTLCAGSLSASRLPCQAKMPMHLWSRRLSGRGAALSSRVSGARAARRPGAREAAASWSTTTSFARACYSVNCSTYIHTARREFPTTKCRVCRVMLSFPFPRMAMSHATLFDDI